MGARLVTLVLMRWTHLGDAEFRLLVRMAHTALDEPTSGVPAGMYFGGHGLLMATLRSEGGSVDTLARRVRKAVNGLVEAGAVERVNQARSGANGVYRLTLYGTAKIDSSGSVDEGQQVPDVPAEEVPGDPAQQVPEVPPSRYQAHLPRNHEEPIEELYEEEIQDLRTAVTQARASPCPDHPGIPDGGTGADGLPRCPFCRRAARHDRPKLTVIEGGAA